MKAKFLVPFMLVLTLVLAACPAPAAAPGGDSGDAAGGDMAAEDITIEVLTFTGPQIAEPLQRRGAEYADATGVNVNVTVVPFGDLYQKVLTDLSTGTNAFDVYVFAPQ